MVVMIIKMMMVITVMCMEGKVMDGSMIFLCAKGGGGAGTCVCACRASTDRQAHIHIKYTFLRKVLCRIFYQKREAQLAYSEQVLHISIH